MEGERDTSVQIIRTCLRHPLTLKVLLVKILCQFLERTFFCNFKTTTLTLELVKKKISKHSGLWHVNINNKAILKKVMNSLCYQQKLQAKRKLQALTPVDNSELVATVTASLEQGTRVKAVVVQLTADQTLKATGSFPVLIKKCI